MQRRHLNCGALAYIYRRSPSSRWGFRQYPLIAQHFVLSRGKFVNRSRVAMAETPDQNREDSEPSHASRAHEAQTATSASDSKRTSIVEKLTTMAAQRMASLAERGTELWNEDAERNAFLATMATVAAIEISRSGWAEGSLAAIDFAGGTVLNSLYGNIKALMRALSGAQPFRQEAESRSSSCPLGAEAPVPRLLNDRMFTTFVAAAQESIPDHPYMAGAVANFVYDFARDTELFTKMPTDSSSGQE